MNGYQKLGLAIVLQACEDALNPSNSPYQVAEALKYLNSDLGAIHGGEFAKKCHDAIQRAIKQGTTAELRKTLQREKAIIVAEQGGSARLGKKNSCTTNSNN